MTFVKPIGGAAALGMAMLIAAGLAAPPAQAAYTVTLAQVGSNVVATGSGTLDLTGLSSLGTADTIHGMSPHSGDIITGLAGLRLVDAYTGFTGPASFGSGGETFADGGSGDTVGIFDENDVLFVPAGYVSGSALTDASTYAGQTFTTLGVTSGTYIWTWGAVATADDSFTLDVVPEPSGVLLLALPLGLVALLAARPRRAPHNARVCRDIVPSLAS